nr:hypothetical protein CFP56_31067 [Quercus suber]
MREMLHHMFPMHDVVPDPIEEDMASDPVVGGPGVEQPTQGPNEVSLQFLKLLKDVEEPCYEDNFCENVPYNITIDNAHDVNDNLAWTRKDVEGTIYETPLFVERELVEDDNIDEEEFIDDVYESNDESTDDENKDGEELNDGSNDDSTDDES